MQRRWGVLSIFLLAAAACSVGKQARVEESERRAEGRSAFDDCDFDSDCPTGHLCKQGRSLFGSGSNSCWPQCGSCPDYFFCPAQTGVYECEEGLDMRVTPETATAGRPLTLHVDVKSPPAPVVKYVWTFRSGDGATKEVVTEAPDVQYPDAVIGLTTIAGSVQTKDDRDRGGTRAFEIRVECLPKGEVCTTHADCCGYSAQASAKEHAVGCLAAGPAEICRAPNAMFVIEGPTTAKVGVEVTFKAVEKDELGGSFQYFFTTYEFGDGTKEDLVHDAATHTYAAPGAFTVRAMPSNETTPVATLDVIVTP